MRRCKDCKFRKLSSLEKRMAARSLVREIKTPYGSLKFFVKPFMEKNTLLVV